MPRLPHTCAASEALGLVEPIAMEEIYKSDRAERRLDERVDIDIKALQEIKVKAQVETRRSPIRPDRVHACVKRKKRGARACVRA